MFMRVLRRSVKVLGSLLVSVIVFLAIVVAYSTMKGTTEWFFRVNGQVTVAGRKTSGYMHANTRRTFLLVTTTDGRKPETYVVPQISIKMWVCGSWHPIRFLPIPMSPLYSSCNLPADPATVVDPPLPRTLVCRPRSVEFTTASGRKVKAEW
jgi:hypothetical protein